MPNRFLLLACGILLGSLALTAPAAEPAAKADAKTAPAEAATEQAPASPVFVGVLKEGEKLPTPAEIYAAKKAAADKADLDLALKESLKIAIHIGTFALKLVIAILIAALIGAGIAALVTWIRRRKHLMSHKQS